MEWFLWIVSKWIFRVQIKKLFSQKPSLCVYEWQWKANFTPPFPRYRIDLNRNRSLFMCRGFQISRWNNCALQKSRVCLNGMVSLTCFKLNIQSSAKLQNTRPLICMWIVSIVICLVLQTMPLKLLPEFKLRNFFYKSLPFPIQGVNRAIFPVQSASFHTRSFFSSFFFYE